MGHGCGGLGLSGATPTSAAAYNGNNQLIASNPDAAGNAQTVGSYSRAYDAENRQISETNTIGNPAAQYTYDGSGHRVQKIAGAAPNSQGGAPPCQTCYLTFDHLGSTRLVTDESANVVALHDYLPFGEEIPGNSVGRSSLFGSGVDQVNQKFTGQTRDQETGLDYFHARYFGAAVGRFSSPDPLNAGADPANPQSWNGYAYVINNPLAYTDPTGMFLSAQPYGDGGGGDFFFSGFFGGFFGGGAPIARIVEGGGGGQASSLPKFSVTHTEKLPTPPSAPTPPVSAPQPPSTQPPVPQAPASNGLFSKTIS